MNYDGMIWDGKDTMQDRSEMGIWASNTGNNGKSKGARGFTAIEINGQRDICNYLAALLENSMVSRTQKKEKKRQGNIHIQAHTQKRRRRQGEKRVTTF